MATPPSGYGQWAITVQLTGAPHLAVMTCGFSFTGIPTAAQLNTRLRNAMTSTGSIFDTAQYASNFTVVNTYVLQNLSGSLFADNNTTAIAGALTRSIPSYNCSLIVRKVTSLAGRQFRGRFLAPCLNIAEGDVNSGGNIGGTSLTASTAAWATFYTQLNAFALPPVLLHDAPKTGPTPIPTPINAFTVNPLIGTIRRRIRS